jgi:kinesin family protein 5
VESLTTQLQDLEDSLQSSQKEGILLKKQITVIEQELLNSQEEVHEVMQALEELAISYDSKDREIETAHSEKKLFLKEMEKLQVRVFCVIW